MRQLCVRWSRWGSSSNILQERWFDSMTEANMFIRAELAPLHLAMLSLDVCRSAGVGIQLNDEYDGVQFVCSASHRPLEVVIERIPETPEPEPELEPASADVVIDIPQQAGSPVLFADGAYTPAKRAKTHVLESL